MVLVSLVNVVKKKSSDRVEGKGRRGCRIRLNITDKENKKNCQRKRVASERGVKGTGSVGHFQIHFTLLVLFFFCIMNDFCALSRLRSTLHPVGALKEEYNGTWFGADLWVLNCLRFEVGVGIDRKGLRQRKRNKSPNYAHPPHVICRPPAGGAWP